MGEKVEQVYFTKQDNQMTINIWKDVQDNYSPGECKLKPGVTVLAGLLSG